jgi:hypothetical protein
MYFPTLRCLPACATLPAAVSLAAVAVDDRQDDEGFTPLFNGNDLTGWKTVIDPKRKDIRPEGTFAVWGRPVPYRFRSSP